MGVAKDYKDAFGKPPTAEVLVGMLLIEKYYGDRRINSSGYWLTPNEIYIDWNIFKDTDFLEKRLRGSRVLLKELVILLQKKMRCDVRERTINQILN